MGKEMGNKKNSLSTTADLIKDVREQVYTVEFNIYVDG